MDHSPHLAPAPIVSPAGRGDRDDRSGPGWFDSSWELHCGLEVREGWPGEERVGEWLDDYLSTLRTAARTASPRASTAIA